MTDPIVTTDDWTPDAPCGYVRDLRVRWALEEAWLPCRELRPIGVAAILEKREPVFTGE